MIKCPHCGSTDYQRRGVRNGKQRYQCNGDGCFGYFAVHHDETTGDAPSFKLPRTQVRAIERGSRFVVTTALNNTPVDLRFWGALLRYVKDRGAQLLVIPTRYYNPAGKFARASDVYKYHWPAEVQPYLVENDLQLHHHLRVMGHIRVTPTAVSPLSGLEALSGGASAIIGHPQIAMETIATPQEALPKIMHTTGSVSVKQYTDSKAGEKGAFHHSLGALVVEKARGEFHMRVLNADHEGGFYDLNRYYAEDGLATADYIPALITGDEHARFRDPSVLQAVYLAEDSMVNTLRPKQLVRHDVFDGYSCSPHHKHDPITQFAKWSGGASDVRGELELTQRHIEETTPTAWDCQNLVVASNHHDFLRRWLCNADPKRDPQNALVYHELMAAVLERTRMGPGGAESPDPFALWAEPRMQAPTRFLARDEHVTIEGVLVSLHGDRGAGGSRGSRAGYARLGTKTVVGHSHAPGIRLGCYQVGTSSVLMLDYTRGAPSAHFHTMCAVLPNGKRQLLHVVGGAWRG